MTQWEVKTARVIFYIAALVGAIYGLLFLSMPERALELSHDPGVPPDLPGCAGVAGFSLARPNSVARGTKPRQTEVAGGLAACLFVGGFVVALLSGEYRGAQWFIWLPILINVGFSLASVATH